MARNPVREILADITAASRGARVGIPGKGRLKRTPDFTKPKISSSRPKSDRGVTFHFAHKTISKRGDVSDSQRDATSAPSHQGYIERLEAVEVSKEDLAQLASDTGLTKARTSRHEGLFVYPELVLEPGRESFGTLGDNKSDRADFWRTVETSEGRTARVQSRIIAELPHEVTQKERVAIAMDFCRSFTERELPFWATIHAPTKANDKRNFHLHIAYYDRPAARSASGEWDFSAIRTRVKPNRVRVERRPFKQNKSTEVRNRDWVRTLRHEFADSSNKILESGPYEKRLDPRSYRESGIAKSPTEHLGFKSNAAEKFGLETTRGRRNTRKEFDWRMTVAVAAWNDLIGEHDATLLFEDYTADDAGWARQKETKQKLSEGRKAASDATKFDLLGEAISLRLGSRRAFLDDERSRVGRNEKLRTTPDSQQAISLIEIESAIIENRLPDIQQIVTTIQDRAEELRVKEKSLWQEVRPLVVIDRDEIDESIFDGMPTYPLAKVFETDEVEPVETNPFSTEPMATPLSEVFGDDPFAEDAHVDQTKRPDPEKPAGSESARSEEELPAATPESSTTPKAPAPVAPTTDQASEATPTIPGTLLVPEISRRQELHALNEKLMAMTNREVRVRAITSRDASEFLDAGEERLQAKRGWILLRSEAEKRGIDLETGVQDLAKARDPERAKLHRDQGQESVLEIREEVIRVMSR